ncbi:MAG TPA: hypothetical protein PLO16_15040 [Acidocella sp.]|nr:hypothetical protein [Acidocella sp.]
MKKRPFQPWTVDQIREAHRLRRLGCDTRTIADLIGVEQHRVERLLSVTQPEVTYVG